MTGDLDALHSAERKLLPVILAEARRQLNICNACRYCEGLCAVFPALERRSLLETGDISQLANLCHDCRACFDACMYAPPHEFAVNIPTILNRVRVEDYSRYVWPLRVPRVFRGWPGVFVGGAAAAAVVVIVSLLTRGASAIIHDPNGARSPYAVLPYPWLLALMLAPSAFAVVVAVGGGRAYWRSTGSISGKVKPRLVWQATVKALTLSNLRGGGADCYYPQDDHPSPSRRRFHLLAVGGFGLCLVSTASAAVLQDIVGSQPPYPVLSVPVISGIAGGIGLIVGCVGLWGLKLRSSPRVSVRDMTIKDYGLLSALIFLAVSGFATLILRDTAAFGVAFLIHVAAVGTAFATMPYSKFPHAIYRYLALIRDETESIHVPPPQ